MKRIGRWFVGQWALAVGLTSLVLAAAIKLGLTPQGDARTPFLLLLGAVLAAAWYGGLWPGLATTLLAAVVGDYLFVPADSSFTSGHAREAVALGIFLVEGVLVSALASRLRHTGRTPGPVVERRRSATQLEPGSRPSTGSAWRWPASSTWSGWSRPSPTPAWR